MTNKDIIPKISFCFIVLDGEPFIKYNYRSIYPFAYEIVIAEGASLCAKRCATKEGHSSDSTLDTLYQLKKNEDPDNKLKIITAETCGYANGFWTGEKDEQFRTCFENATGDYVWQIDVDEFYRYEDMHEVIKILTNSPDISGISFDWKNFWGGFDSLVNGWEYNYLLERQGGVRRIFKKSENYRFMRHRPPTVIDESGIDLFNKQWLSAEFFSKKNIYCYHYGMIFPIQAEFKSKYYSNMWNSHKNMFDWKQSVFDRIEKPFSILHGTHQPSWLEAFNNEHPEQINLLRDDIASGCLNIKLRHDEDIKRLLKSFYYVNAVKILQKMLPVYIIARKIKTKTRQYLKTAKNSIINVLRPTIQRHRAKKYYNSISFERFLKRPQYLKIETTNICNAKCRFCLYTKTTRAKGTMSMELFKKVIDEYVDAGGGALTISPLVGDVLLDKYLVERLEYCRKYPQITNIGFHTNFIGHTRWSDDELKQIMSYIDVFNCSIAPNRDIYNAMFGVDKFDIVLEGLERLLRLKDECNVLVNLNGRACGAGFEEDTRLVKLSVLLMKQRITWLTEYSEWGEQALEELPLNTKIIRATNELKIYPCLKPFISNIVFWNGKVGLCACEDNEAKLIIGDVTQNNLADILAGEKRKDYIKSFFEKKLNSHCSNCTFYESVRKCDISKWKPFENPFNGN